MLNNLTIYTFISGSGEMQLSRKEIFIALQGNLNCTIDEAFKKIENLVSEKFQSSYTLTDNMKQICRRLFHSFRIKWQQVKRTKQMFFKKYDEWLNVSLSFSNPAAISKTPKKKRVRPSSKFTSSDRSKRRKTEEICSSSSSEELSYATQTLLTSGKVDAAKIVKDVTLGSPTKATKYRRSMDSISETILSSDSALLVLMEQKLSKSQYQGLQAISKENNCKLYPPYKAVLQAKQKCYPSKTDITITDCSAEVKLQALLDHTVERILLTQNDVIKSSTSDIHISNMTLICKWGCNGTSEQSVYKQKFNSDDESISDSNIFFTSLVPLQLISVNSKAEIVVWKNPRPSSPRFCRPIKLQFIHENMQDTLKEVQYIKEQEKKLVPFQTILNGKNISVSYKLAFTVIDSEICNAVTSTSSAQRCFLCQATSKQFNDIDGILEREVENNLCFGLSILHVWIRFFECCLHLSYKLDLKKWQARSKEEKKMVEIRKKIIQKGFRLQLELMVDQPKAGFESSNDGNTAWRFFENSTTSAVITGVDENLIKRFHVLLQAISSGYEINAQKFQEYALETARRFTELYSWYYMPTSVHKILIHGPQIIASALLPIGQLSEDVQEASNKYIKRFCEDFSRKSSRVKNMEDVFLRLLVTSDPYISSLKKLPQKKFKSLTPEAIDLLVSPGVSSDSCIVHNEDTSDEDSNDSDNDE